ncbi:uncharacterized protein SRS1_10112 [Sporisorium reilianum f. sp. reilianum]|uniref:Uncharacterized protein n=1 Tax=Sporisorium reilianum f. sp. reilianum TaxID=72559 RepID=A0A2N8U6Z7_9BASI|nr:uncharacterized protein SRS1_10112 [Sporisorium reilianum f. sp. reilianum]
MDSGWISSLSIATSINTVSASESTPLDDSFELTGDGCSFPPPPPRMPESSTMADPTRFDGCHDANRRLIGSPAGSSASLRYPGRGSRPSSRSSRTDDNAKQRLSNSDHGHIGWAEEAAQEPLEQLRSSRYDASLDLSDRESSAGHPSSVQRLRSHTSDMSGMPRSEDSNSLLRQRPRVLSGLPTSYHHNRDRSQSSSLPDSSRSSHSPSQSFGSIATQITLASAEEDSAKSSSSRPFLSSSPALHLVNIDRPWAHWVSDYAGKSTSSATVATNHTRVPSNSVRDTSSSSDHSHSHGHSRHPSLSFSVATRPSSPDSRLEPYRSDYPPDTERPTRSEKQRTTVREHGMRNPFEEGHNDVVPHTRARSDSAPVSQSLPNLFAAPAAATQHVAWERAAPNPAPGSHATLPHGTNTALVITNGVGSPCYLEPYNSCEAIAFPRPRLRSRSLATHPTIVVEKVHAAPERFWQRPDHGYEAENVAVAPRSSILRSGERANEHLEPPSAVPSQAMQLSASAKDQRLKLHENIPPPLPPKDSPLPSSGLLPQKPLPSVPLPHSAPLPRASQDSFDSIELLDADELLQRNEELEQERRAWREEAQSGLGVDYNALRERFSPCLRDPSLATSNRQEDATSADAHEAGASPIRVHRMWNKDGTEHTVLVVHSRNGHPYGNQRMSVSSPDLGEGRGTASRRVPLVKHFAQRLGSFATGRRARASATGKDRSSSAAQHDAREPPQSTSGSGRSFVKERKLVSDETVIIGKPPESANAAGVVAGQVGKNEPQMALQEGRQALEHASVQASRRESLSMYRPAGKKDEIKAQLSEAMPPIWRHRKSGAPRSAGEEHEVDALTWIDPGSSKVMQGKLILHESFRARQQSETEELGPEGGRHALYSSWSDYASRRGSKRSRASDQAMEQALASHPAEAFSRRESALLAEGDFTRTSSMSTETPTDLVVWDASSVDIDDLFFRPPQ